TSSFIQMSNTGIGAVLLQIDEEGIENPVYYASRTFSPPQRKWSATVRECYAVKWACHHFRPYLLGRPFVVYTDHSALAWLMRTKEHTSKLIRWVLELQEYDMKIISRPGSANANADALSRLSALLEAREPQVHYTIVLMTRTRTHSLPAARRDR